MNLNKNRGITLIEMVVSMTVIGIAAVSVVTVVSTMGKTKSDARDIAIGGMLLQACAEKIMAVKEVMGFAYFATHTPSCTDLNDSSSVKKYGNLEFSSANVGFVGACADTATKCTVTIQLCKSCAPSATTNPFLKPLVFDVANF